MTTLNEALEDYKIVASVRIQKSLLARAFSGLQYHDKFLYENMKKDKDYQKLSKLLNEIIDLGLVALTQFVDLKPNPDDMIFITELSKQKSKRAKRKKWDK